MMQNWFECKVRYEKTKENGVQKKVTEPYLIDALSFTEAEARIIEVITPYICGEFTLRTVNRKNISEVFLSENESDDRYYELKVAFITLHEKSGVEKESTTTMLVQASSIRTALDNLVEGMKGSLADYRVKSIKETKIIDVFPYKENEDVNK